MSEFLPQELHKGDALLLVDVQKDFLPGGNLAVPEGDKIIPVLNQYITRFHDHSLPIFASRDWHPVDHCSFRKSGGPWPEHCMQQSRGAELADDLELPEDAVIISKGVDKNIDAYSAFQETELHDRLKAAGVKRLFVGGLATDYCVLHTVEDARRLGYEVWLLEDAIRAVDVHRGDGQHAIEAMVKLGAHSCCGARAA